MKRLFNTSVWQRGPCVNRRAPPAGKTDSDVPRNLGQESDIEPSGPFLVELKYAADEQVLAGGGGYRRDFEPRRTVLHGPHRGSDAARAAFLLPRWAEGIAVARSIGAGRCVLLPGRQGRASAERACRRFRRGCRAHDLVWDRSRGIAIGGPVRSPAGRGAISTTPVVRLAVLSGRPCTVRFAFCQTFFIRGVAR